MPERLDRVTILLNDGPVVISWDDRLELLMRMDGEHNAGARLQMQFLGVGAVGAVGATRNVTPDLEEKRYLRGLLGGPQPPLLDAPREGLDDDLHDADATAG